MLKITMSLTPGGSPWASCESPCEELGIFLAFDIQGSINSCQLTLDKSRLIINGEVKNWEQHWNFYSTVITLEEVVIKNDYRATQCKVSLEDFISSLELWKEFLLKNFTY